MNVTLTCDHLLSNDHFTQCLASLLDIFPQAPIYTLAHRRGSIPALLQERTIHAGHISHKVANTGQLLRHSWAIPKTAEHLSIPCSTDLIFSFSSGLGHGIKKCKKTRQIVYLYRDYTPGPGLTQKFFASYLKSWSQKKLAQCDHLWVADVDLWKAYRPYYPNIQLVQPGSKVECFIRPTPLTRPTFYAIEAPITIPLKRALGRCGCPWKPLESSQILKQSQALISLNSSNEFPEKILESLALGNPVIIQDTALNRRFFRSLENRGVTFIKDLSDLPSALRQCPFPAIPGPLRSLALQYGESRFQSTVRKLLKKIVDSSATSSEERKYPTKPSPA